MNKKLRLTLKSFLFSSIALNLFLLFWYKTPQRLYIKISERFIQKPTQFKKKIYPTEKKPFVYHASATKILTVPEDTVNQARVLPEHLIISPGTYHFQGVNFKLKKEGLYRFMMGHSAPEQRIVYKKDLYALLSGISWVVTHGFEDDNTSPITLMAKATKEKLFLSCGHVSHFAKYILDKHKYESRIVMGMGVKNRLNTISGHVLLELKNPKTAKWEVVDLDQNCRFINPKTGKAISFLELTDSSIRKNYNMVYLSNDVSFDVHHSRKIKKHWISFFDETLALNRKDWYQEVFQIPLIFQSSTRKYYFFNSEYENEVKNYSHLNQKITRQKFVEMFYPMEH